MYTVLVLLYIIVNDALNCLQLIGFFENHDTYFIMNTENDSNRDGLGCNIDIIMPT